MINKSRAKINRIKEIKDSAQGKKFVSKEEALQVFITAKNEMDSLYASYDKQTIQIEEFFKQIKKNIIEARVCMSTNMDVIHAQEFFQSGITQHFLQL